MNAVDQRASIDPDVLAVCIHALDGDGSTEYLPDVTRFDAALWMLQALSKAGYVVGKSGPAVSRLTRLAAFVSRHPLLWYWLPGVVAGFFGGLAVGS